MWLRRLEMCVASGGMYFKGLWKFGGGMFTDFRLISLVTGLLGWPSYDFVIIPEFVLIFIPKSYPGKTDEFFCHSNWNWQPFQMSFQFRSNPWYTQGVWYGIRHCRKGHRNQNNSVTLAENVKITSYWGFCLQASSASEDSCVECWKRPAMSSSLAWE